MSDGTITETALRLRAEALIAANSAPLLDTGDLDGRLVEAERRFRASKERRRALFEEFQSEREAARFEEAVWDSDYEKVLLKVIKQASPRTLAGATAKLRVIIWHNDLDDDPEFEEVIAGLEPLDRA